MAVRKLSRDELRSLGYSPSSERYTAPGDPRADTHGTISRRQAEAERYYAGGWSSRAQFERRYQGATGRKFARFEAEAIEQGVLGKRSAPDAKFAQLFNAWRSDRFRERGTKNTPAARFLTYVGLRDPGASYPVGSTPPRKA